MYCNGFLFIVINVLQWISFIVINVLQSYFYHNKVRVCSITKKQYSLLNFIICCLSHQTSTVGRSVVPEHATSSMAQNNKLRFELFQHFLNKMVHYTAEFTYSKTKIFDNGNKVCSFFNNFIFLTK